jgi:hypothetical protein
MNVGSKEVVDGLFPVAHVSVGMDCLHKPVHFALTMITQLQERTESER